MKEQVVMNNFFSVDLESLDADEIERMAIESGFQTRKPRKIKPIDLLSLYCIESINKSPSFNDIATAIDDLTGKGPSRQAVGKRIDEKFVGFLKKVLEVTLGKKMKNVQLDATQTIGDFRQVLVQDSTIIQLPSALFDEFSGVSNAHSKVCNARIQAVYELRTKTFVSFSIDKYSKNDLLAAPELEVNADDLVLRDRGYMLSSEMERIKENGASFVYRHITGVIYRDLQSNDPIDLEKVLTENDRCDMEVRLNNEAGTVVRIVAERLNEEAVNVRRMRARKETKGHNPSAKALFLMGWTIYVTNLPKEKYNFKSILAIYGCRWRIECIFKTWKSNMAFDILHNVSVHQLQAIIMARLIAITIIMRTVFKVCVEKHAVAYGRTLSLHKLMRYIQAEKTRMVEIIEGVRSGSNAIVRKLMRYCSYDKRKQRLNYVEQEAIVFNLFL